MIRTIIIDDEQHCIDRLSRLLEENCKQSILLMDSFKNVKDAKNGIERLKPELIFLDVSMSDGTGFDLLQQFKEIHFEVIFTTAFEKYAVQAFRFSAIDYLMKPVDAGDLSSAVGKLSKRISEIEKTRKFETLIHNIHHTSKRVAVPTITGYTYLNTDEIVRLESEINYTHIFLKDQSKIMVAKTLKEFEEMLTDHGFFRVHNSHLINTRFIKSYNRGKGGFVTLSDNKQIEVSTRRKEPFLAYLEKNW